MEIVFFLYKNLLEYTIKLLNRGNYITQVST